MGPLFKAELTRVGQAAAPIWVVTIADPKQSIADALKRLFLFDTQLSGEERERFRRFVPEEQERARAALKVAVQDAIKARDYWVAGMASAPEGRLKTVGEQIFAQVYPGVIPFPFDGFATTAGGGPADAAQLARSLITGQVDGTWVQAQTKRLQNRVGEVLVRSWRALPPSGQITAPMNPRVKAVFDALVAAHQADPRRTLWQSYQGLIAPPHGMNTASAALLLGLLIGGVHPPRRLVQADKMVAAADWLGTAFPSQRGKHQLETAVLQETRLRFLSADSAGRWRELLARWETEQRYPSLVALAKEAEQMQRVDPMPEASEGHYRYLRDRSEQAARELGRFRNDLVEWEQGIERAERQNNVGELLKHANLLMRRRHEVEDGACWPASFGDDCAKQLAIVRELVAERLADWMPRQGCHNAADVATFRHRIEKGVETLKRLGFDTEARVLSEQAQRSIMQVEQRQRFKLTLDESDDYPRQPAPTDSTPVRELLDDIAKGEALCEALEAARAALSEPEIQARVKAIRQRQQMLRDGLERQRGTLAKCFASAPGSHAELLEAVAVVNRLREIFVGTRDASEVSELALQLQRLAEDVQTWEAGDIPPERLDEILDQQCADQCAALTTELAARDIEPAWALDALYRVLAEERIEAARRRSTDWLRPRVALEAKIPTMTANACARTESELADAPGYLSAPDREALERLQERLGQRIAVLETEARAARLAAWRAGLPSPDQVTRLDQHQTASYLKTLENPPERLSPSEYRVLEPIAEALHAHYDQMSIDEIRTRIERLPLERQRDLLVWLSGHLGGV